MKNFIKNILAHPVFSYIYIFCCSVLKVFKSPRKIVFYSTPDMADNSWALFNYILNNKDNYKLVWICHNKKLSQLRLRGLNLKSNRVCIYNKFSLLALLHFVTSKYAFTTTVFYPFVKKGHGPICINLWHGMPIKKIGSMIGENNLGDPFVYSISTSDLFSTIMSECLSMDRGNILPFGNPKNDAFLLPNKLEKKSLLKHFKLPEKSSMVFWMPTFRKAIQNDFSNDSNSDSFLREWDDINWSELDLLLGENKVALLIKLHPMDVLNKTNLPDSFINITFISSAEWSSSGFDLYESLEKSDGLISDISSVLIDYLVSKKPIAITRRVEENYSRGLIKESAAILDEFYSIDTSDALYYFLSQLDGIKVHDNDFYLKYNAQAVTRELSSQLLLDFLNIK